MEYCEFLGENSRLYEPRDADTRTKVLAAIKEEATTEEEDAVWINAVKKKASPG